MYAQMEKLYLALLPITNNEIFCFLYNSFAFEYYSFTHGFTIEKMKG